MRRQVIAFEHCWARAEDALPCGCHFNWGAEDSPPISDRGVSTEAQTCRIEGCLQIGRRNGNTPNPELHTVQPAEERGQTSENA